MTRIPARALRLCTLGALLAAIGAAPNDMSRLIAPVALATGSGDVVYVADPGAQRVFERRGGVLAELAGSGAPDATGLVPGGFADGPAADARFDDPEGIAVTDDASVLVADRGNRRIRRIAGGTVTTFAGTVDAPGASDGPLATARFANPVGIANAGDGVLYVADRGAGIRRIAGGRITTLALAGLPLDLWGISAVVDDGVTTLFCGTPRGLLVIDATHATFHLASGPSNGERNLGVAAGTVAVDAHTAIFADPADRTVRSFYERRNTPGFDVTDAQPIPERSLREDESGYGAADAPLPPGEPQLERPTGIARLANGALVVADPAAGRLADLPPPDLRHVVSDDVSDLALDGSRYYRIALVSNSYAYFDVSYAQTIGATLENDLNAARASDGPGKPVRVLSVRIAAVTAENEADYITTVLPGTVDLVVWLFNDVHVYAVAPGHGELLKDPNWWKVPVTKAVTSVAGALSAAHTGFVLAYFTPAEAASYLEGAWSREDKAPLTHGALISDDLRALLAEDDPGLIDLSPAIFAEELSPQRRALFGTENLHLSVYGNAFLGHELARALSERKPWRP